MGLPRIRVECYRALDWGNRYEKALRRLLVDSELSPGLREQATAMADQVSAFEKVLLPLAQPSSLD
jgi:hypothetical protein